MAGSVEILLVEDNPGDARLVTVYLAESDPARFAVTHVSTMAEAEERLAKETFDVVLLDLGLPDGSGIEVVARTKEARPDIPIVVLTGRSDEETGMEAVKEGAQDYLLKAELSGSLLARSIRYAVERHHTGVALELAKEAAEEANESKSRFLASISHEVRTPLNCIMSMSELLMRKGLPQTHEEYVDAIKTSADSLLEIITDILDISRIEAGKLTLESTDFEFRAALDGMLKALGIWAAQKGLTILHEVDDDVPHVVLGDPTRLRQIVSNLVSNAVKFTEQGSVAVKAAVDSHEEGGVRLLMSVEDTGVGIPQNKQAAIFEAFSQVDSSTTRRHSGSGLGLAIAHQLVSMMDGRMWVESEVGRGSTFYFTALFGLGGERAEPADTWGESFASEPTPQLQKGGSLRVLAVDDIRFNLIAVRELLGDCGHSVVTIGSAPEALELLKTDSFDVILMDVQMPDMDGFQATAAIRATEKEKGSRTPIIGLTAHATEEDRERCRQAGMDGYVPKPIQIDDLLRVMGQLVFGSAAAVVSEQTQSRDGCFDRQTALDQLDGNEALLKRLVALFFDDYPGYLAEIREAIEAGDSKRLGDAAHGLKGPVSTIALTGALELVIELQDRGKQGKLDGAAEVYSALEEEIKQAEPGLSTYCDS